MVTPSLRRFKRDRVRQTSAARTAASRGRGASARLAPVEGPALHPKEDSPAPPAPREPSAHRPTWRRGGDGWCRLFAVQTEGAGREESAGPLAGAAAPPVIAHRIR